MPKIEKNKIKKTKTESERRKASERRSKRLDGLFKHAVKKGVFLETRQGSRRKSKGRRKDK